MARQDITWSYRRLRGLHYAASSARLVPQLALIARVLADGQVERQPRRALEMWAEDRARREPDASTFRRFRLSQRVVNMREALPDKHAVGRLREQCKSDAIDGARHCCAPRQGARAGNDRYLR